LHIADHPEACIGYHDRRSDAGLRKLRDYAGYVAIDIDVTSVRARLPACSSNFDRHRLQLLEAPRDQSYAPPPARELARQRHTDTRGGPGDQGAGRSCLVCHIDRLIIPSLRKWFVLRSHNYPRTFDDFAEPVM
jgi:hypothetical protein